LENFGEKIKKVKNSLSSWAYRDLTYFGRITAMKTLSNLCRLSLYYQTLLFKFWKKYKTLSMNSNGMGWEAWQSQKKCYYK
jgi:hypothetical protein